MIYKSVLVFTLLCSASCGVPFQSDSSSNLQNSNDGFEGRPKVIKNAFNTFTYNLIGLGVDSYEGEDIGKSCSMSFKKVDAKSTRLGFLVEGREVGFFMARSANLKGQEWVESDGSYRDLFFNETGFSVELTVVDDAYNIVSLKYGKKYIVQCEQDM